MLSYTEENYLKALLKLSMAHSTAEVGTNELAQQLHVKPGTVTDMLKKLKEKKLIAYEKYGKITLSQEGRRHGLEVIRKHRLWETFLCSKLEFTWDEVHEVAEQLEHIQSVKLTNKLDKFLGYPKFDPHGDPIPTADGELNVQDKKLLSAMKAGQRCQMVGVCTNDAPFLQYAEELGLGIGTVIDVLRIHPFDGSMNIQTGEKLITVSEQFCSNVFVVA